MSLEALSARIPDFAKDVRLNLSSMLRDEALSDERKWGLLLACAIATRNAEVAKAAEVDAKANLTPAALNAARAAACMMAMNNIYYRFTHLASNKDYAKLPAKLRMQVIGAPGVDKATFELWSLAVSAINGCGMCIDSHELVLREHGVTTEEIHTAARFAAIVQSVAVAIEAGDAAA
jgi:alkyl hydroperoxide reductase subunit D